MAENKVFLVFNTSSTNSLTILNFYDTLDLYDELNEAKQNQVLKEHSLRLTSLENETLSLKNEIKRLDKRIDSKIITSTLLEVDNEVHDYVIFTKENAMRIKQMRGGFDKTLSLGTNNMKLGG